MAFSHHALPTANDNANSHHRHFGLAQHGVTHLPPPVNEAQQFMACASALH
jgi:hypothetical protein